MASVQDQKSLNLAGNTSKQDPFINSIEPDGVDLIDLTAQDEPDLAHLQKSLRVNKSLRNYALDADHYSVKQVPVDGSNYKVGHFVELREPLGIHTIRFIEIKSIHIYEQTKDVVIRGLPYARTRNLHGRFLRQQNEVCLVFEIDADDARPDEEQALIQIGPDDILKKRILTKTNKPFPYCRFDPIAYATTKQREEQGPLTCRWKMRILYKDASQRRAGRFQGLASEHFSERDGDNIKKRNLGVDNDRSLDWRSDTMPGGSTFLKPDFIKDEVDDGEPMSIQRYSFAEVGAGAGGASRGAEMGGFKVILAAESCHHAGKTYLANFPNVKLYQMGSKEFAAAGAQKVIDVLYLSSSALDEAGDDPESVKKICTDLLDMARSRLIFMDQPASITSESNAPFLNAICRSFTEAGWSFEGRVVHMVDFGLPQVRKRFILIGAGPGEALPSWPTATHSSNPTEDQQPLFTEWDAIGTLNPVLHSMHEPKSLQVMDFEERDADKPIQSPINASGSVYHHPDGERDFTPRELACLQGFPTYHQFEGSYLKKQIGNAFPPSVVMAFCQHLRMHLEQFDGVLTGPLEPDEIAGHPLSLFSEARNSIMMGGVLYDDLPNSPHAEVMPSFPLSTRSVEVPVTPLSRDQKGTAVMPLSPRQTMSPETQPSSGVSSLASCTLSQARQFPTPSTGGRSTSVDHTAGLQLKRGRDLYEDLESDDNDDDDEKPGPMVQQTPSKRPRLSSPRVGSHDTSRASSRANSSSSDDTTGMV